MRSLRLQSLVASTIVTADGRKLGRVVDIEVTQPPEFRVHALVYGKRGWLDRLGVLIPLAHFAGRSGQPKTVPWDVVDRFEEFTITLKPGYEPGDE